MNPVLVDAEGVLIAGHGRVMAAKQLGLASVPVLRLGHLSPALALGCTPLVNLFPQRCEPVALDDTLTEYRVVPDARRVAVTEIWSVERVREPLPDGSARPWRPFHRLTHADPEPDIAGGHYATVRRQAPGGDRGTEVYLAPQDAEFEPLQPRDAVLSVDALCLNRDLPADLPVVDGRPGRALVEGAAAVAGLQAMTAATPTLRRPLRQAGAWRLISHLSLSHLSVVGGADGAAALREVLRLYDLRDSAETRAAIGASLEITAQPGAARLPRDQRGPLSGAFCRGLDLTLGFDPRGWETGGLYLLATVLDRFLGLHATVNAFVRTRAVLRGRPVPVAGCCCDRGGAAPGQACGGGSRRLAARPAFRHPAALSLRRRAAAADAGPADCRTGQGGASAGRGRRPRRPRSPSP